MKILTLKSPLWATTIHGTTGQEMSDDWLDAGTRIKDLTSCPTMCGREYFFLASTDRGVSWYKQSSFGKPVTREG